MQAPQVQIGAIGEALTPRLSLATLHNGEQVVVEKVADPQQAQRAYEVWRTARKFEGLRPGAKLVPPATHESVPALIATVSFPAADSLMPVRGVAHHESGLYVVYETTGGC